MENFHQKTSRQINNNQPNSAIGRDCEPDGKVEPTLHRKAYKKSEIYITRRQLDEFTRLFKDYDLKKPGWLRQHFSLNNRRRKLLNQVLFEAGCNKSDCGVISESDNWFYLIHEIWHQINEEPSCR